MNRKIKYIMLGIILILFCFFYAHIDKGQNIYNGKIDSSLYLTAELKNGENIAQTFECVEKHIDGMDVKLTSNSPSDTGRLVYSLQDAQGNELLYDTMDISKIKNEKFNKIRFDQTIENCEDKLYTITLGAEGLNEEDSISVYYDPTGEKNGIVDLEGKKSDGTLIFRTITHRFDVETFLVTVGLILYLIIFFRVLYKMFS